MSGTKEGGIKAAKANKKLHGKDFYKRIGQMGGRNGHTGGFAANQALARLAGAKGGRNSHRGAGTDRIERQKKAREMFSNGVSVKEIAKILDRKEVTIYKYLED